MISKENALLLSKNEELLISELSSRLPYGVICECDKIPFKGELREINFTYNMCRLYNVENDTSETCYIYDCKPYLFPLSSMTEKQKKEISKRYNFHNSYGLCIEITNHSEGYWDDDNSCHLQDYLWLVNWLNKNHFDYRGLIEKGLAKDATKLKIY